MAGTLVPPWYVLQPVSRTDIIVASIAWGFTLGFGWLTVWTAMKQTRQIWRRHHRHLFRNAYFWMIWGEITVCLIFAIICYLYLLRVILPSFFFYFCILTTWALQVQFLLQIIVNRCSILMANKRRAWRLKVGVAVIITAVNISVYNIWIPARLQISERYIWINDWWDRCEKCIYLLVDGCLNAYFIRIVKRNLIVHGLTKYRALAHFNMFIVGFSLSMDVLIISMMSLPNTFVYMQFHPLAYMVKLNIEMSMADLIGKIARNRNCGIITDGNFTVNGSPQRSSTAVFDTSIDPTTGMRRRTASSATGAPIQLRRFQSSIARLGNAQDTADSHFRSNSDADTLVDRCPSYASRITTNKSGVGAPKAVYHYGAFGVGLAVGVGAGKTKTSEEGEGGGGAGGGTTRRGRASHKKPSREEDIGEESSASETFNSGGSSPGSIFEPIETVSDTRDYGRPPEIRGDIEQGLVQANAGVEEEKGGTNGCSNGTSEPNGSSDV